MTIVAHIEASRWHRAWSKWQDFCAVYRLLNRKAELERLVRWAERKGLPGPREAYQCKVEDEERRLLQHTFRSPSLVRRARLLHWFSQAFRATPRSLAKGSAVAYRNDYHYKHQKRAYSNHIRQVRGIIT